MAVDVIDRPEFMVSQGAPIENAKGANRVHLLSAHVIVFERIAMGRQALGEGADESCSPLCSLTKIVLGCLTRQPDLLGNKKQ